MPSKSSKAERPPLLRRLWSDLHDCFDSPLNESLAAFSYSVSHVQNGINLATVAHIIHLHGGQVWVEARPGAGATFGFSIPDGRAGIPSQAG